MGQPLPKVDGGCVQFLLMMPLMCVCVCVCVCVCLRLEGEMLVRVCVCVCVCVSGCGWVNGCVFHFALSVHLTHIIYLPFLSFCLSISQRFSSLSLLLSFSPTSFTGQVARYKRVLLAQQPCTVLHTQHHRNFSILSTHTHAQWSTRKINTASSILSPVCPFSSSLFLSSCPAGQP